MGFTTVKKPSSAIGQGNSSLGAMMGAIGQPPKPKPKAGGLGVGSVLGPPPPARTSSSSSSSSVTGAGVTTSGNALAPGLGLGVVSGSTSGASAGAADPPVKVATRLAVAEWLRAVGEQEQQQQGQDKAGGSASQSWPLSLLAFVLAYGAVDHASEVGGMNACTDY